jgi:ribonuclease-3
MQLPNYKKLEKKLGIRFKRKTILKRALTHTSYMQVAKNQSHHETYEILEFLGDAVLELVTREFLIQKYPDAHEGTLSELKKRYTSTDALYRIGKKLSLGTFLFMDKGEASTGGRARPSNIAGCFEAVIGALYLDRGLGYTEKFIQRTILNRRMLKTVDYKSHLNAWAMQQRCPIEYRVTKEKGAPHRKTFHITLYINAKKAGKGAGSTKKRAEQEAARQFLSKKKKSKRKKKK